MRRNRCPFHHLYNDRNVRLCFPCTIFFLFAVSGVIVHVCERMEYTHTFILIRIYNMRETITSNPSEISKLFPLSESKAKHLLL